MNRLENLSIKELDKLMWQEQCKITLIQIRINKIKNLINSKNESTTTSKGISKKIQ